MEINEQKYNALKSQDKPAIKTKEAKETKEHEKIICKAEYSSIDKTLILITDKKGWFDAWRKYYINKDGSGTKVTGFGAKQFPKSTFDDVNKLTEELFKNNGCYMINDEDALTLLKCVLDDIDNAGQ